MLTVCRFVYCINQFGEVKKRKTKKPGLVSSHPSQKKSPPTGLDFYKYATLLTTFYAWSTCGIPAGRGSQLISGHETSWMLLLRRNLFQCFFFKCPFLISLINNSKLGIELNRLFFNQIKHNIIICFTFLSYQKLMILNKVECFLSYLIALMFKCLYFM